MEDETMVTESTDFTEADTLGFGEDDVEGEEYVVESDD